MKKVLFILCLVVVLTSCRENKNSEQASESEKQSDSSDIAFRPNFHFTPKEHWMNDPNGMFYYKGLYHLFFQYYPGGNVWGPMNWGHAVSTDLVTWQQLPIALKPDEKGYIFSGSAVVDKENTSGFGTKENPPIVAIFTYHDAEAAKEGKKDYQSQALAYSVDEGKTWTKYKGNPVLPNPGIENFRDPKVSRDTIHNQWLMALAADTKTLFYSSQNLKKWKLLSEFGEGIGAHGGVWECPDFFPIKVENTGETKWVLIQSLNPGGYNGGSGTQYFVGDFDGKTFKLDSSMKDLGKDHSYWIDYGMDNYAGVTWANAPYPSDKKLFLGWMSNWLYGEKVPTKTWRSAMTFPREMSLKKIGETYRIFSVPLPELNNHMKMVYSQNRTTVDTKKIIAEGENINFSSAMISFDVPVSGTQRYIFQLSNKNGDTLKFGYDGMDKQFFINRKKSGMTDFNEDFTGKVATAPRTSTSDTLSVNMVLDKTSIELFYDKGETVMTEIFFPHSFYHQFSASSTAPFTVENLKIEQLELQNKQQ